MLTVLASKSLIQSCGDSVSKVSIPALPHEVSISIAQIRHHSQQVESLIKELSQVQARRRIIAEERKQLIRQLESHLSKKSDEVSFTESLTQILEADEPLNHKGPAIYTLFKQSPSLSSPPQALIDRAAQIWKAYVLKEVAEVSRTDTWPAFTQSPLFKIILDSDNRWVNWRLLLDVGQSLAEFYALGLSLLSKANNDATDFSVFEINDREIEASVQDLSVPFSRWARAQLDKAVEERERLAAEAAGRELVAFLNDARLQLGCVRVEQASEPARPSGWTERFSRHIQGLNSDLVKVAVQSTCVMLRSQAEELHPQILSLKRFSRHGKSVHAPMTQLRIDSEACLEALKNLDKTETAETRRETASEGTAPESESPLSAELGRCCSEIRSREEALAGLV